MGSGGEGEWGLRGSGVKKSGLRSSGGSGG